MKRRGVQRQVRRGVLAIGLVAIAVAVVATSGAWSRPAESLPDHADAVQVASTSALQVHGVAAFHRHGQTFITWQEPAVAPLGEQPTIQEVRKVRETLRKKRVAIRIYRAPGASGIGQVGRGCWRRSVHSRSGTLISMGKM